MKPSGPVGPRVLQRSSVVRVYDVGDTTVVLGKQGAAHELTGDSAHLVRALLHFLREPHTEDEVIAHVEAVTGMAIGDSTALRDLLHLLESVGALQPTTSAPPQPTKLGKRRIVLAMSGAIAAMHAPGLVTRLLAKGFELRVTATKNTLEFVCARSLEALLHQPVVTELFSKSSPVPHIDLAEWADAVLVWPATATTISRLASGDYGSLSSAVALATSGPVIVVPSMNAGMYAGPAVQRNLARIIDDGMHVLHPAMGPEVADPPDERRPRLGPAPPTGVVVDMLEAVLAMSRRGVVRTAVSAAEWDTLYASTPLASLPWQQDAVDPDIAEVVAHVARPPASVLDVGCGLGQVAIDLAQTGYRVVATDLSSTALDMAQQRAGTTPVVWLQDDITQSRLRGPFDVWVDRGCLHLLNPARARAYAATAARLVGPSGGLVIKVHAESGLGTRTLGTAQIEALFGDAFEPVLNRSTTLPGPSASPAAQLYVLRRRS